MDPASTLDNWAAELRRFAPERNVIVYYGAAAARQALRERHQRAHAASCVREGVHTGSRSLVHYRLRARARVDSARCCCTFQPCVV